MALYGRSADEPSKKEYRGGRGATPTGNAHHRGEHAPIAPHVQTIIVLLEVHKKFRSFKVARSHSDIILCLWVVEFG